MRRAAVLAWGWLERHPYRALGLLVVALWSIRLPFLFRPLESDEGGFLMVADQWHGAGTALYGDQWVDRPPLLLLVFKLAVAFGGSSVVVHLLGGAFQTLLVCAAWWAGRIVNAAKGAVAAAVVAAFAGANLSIGGLALTGELIAGSFVMVSCALVLHAVYQSADRRTSVTLAGLSGVVAALAFLVKQNFVDAGVFAVVLLSLRLRRSWQLLVAFGVGVAAPLAVTAAWAASDDGPGVLRLWRALSRFRQRAFDVVAQSESVSPYVRLRLLALLFVVSGLVFLSGQLLVAVRRVAGQLELRVAVLVMWAYAVVGILVGASWWRHYLLALIPALAIGSALATRREARRLRTHYAATLTAVATAVTTVVGLLMLAIGSVPRHDEQEVASYLREAASPGDGMFVAYGAPDLIWKARLHTPYRYSWSLPMRARDPHLTLLVRVLQGPEAPTWIVEIGDFDWWGIDTTAFREIRQRDYHVAATVCGHDIYLRNGVTRDKPPVPTC